MRLERLQRTQWFFERGHHFSTVQASLSAQIGTNEGEQQRSKELQVEEMKCNASKSTN